MIEPRDRADGESPDWLERQLARASGGKRRGGRRAARGCGDRAPGRRAPRRHRRARPVSPWRAPEPAAGARRLLGLVLHRLARAPLSGEAAAEALARPLRRALRHRRGEQHLLPAALQVRRRDLGRGDPRRLRLRGQGEPLPHPRQAPEGARALPEALLRPPGGADRVRKARAGALAVPRELPPRRRAARGRARALPAAATPSSSATRAGSSRTSTSCSASTTPRW